MAALNFQVQFVPMIESGTKPGTIRQKRKKNPIKVGDVLYLFTGMRTKKCKKFGVKICYEVFDIKITKDAVYLKKASYPGFKEVPLYESMKEGFARMDGFSGYAEFLEFFEKQYGLPFEGDWIVWNSAHAEEALQYIKRNQKAATYEQE